MTGDGRAFRPLLKWPGGKTREWDSIAPHLPATVRHFVDPFMGGLAPFARTEFAGRAHLNDRHGRLVDLHRLVQRKDPALFSDLDGIAADWERLDEVAAAMREPFLAAVDAGRRGGEPHPPPSPELAPFHRAVAGGRPLAEYLVASVQDKARRIPRLESRHGRPFADVELDVQGETAVRAGYYYLVRDHETTARGAAAVADFLFVRDTCYGSMFRFGKNGRFNIPYGGASYNRKSFATRVDRLRAPETDAALRRATFACEDFEPFLLRLHPRLDERDLVFADPPYDSDFSAYGGNRFDLSDHARLASVLTSLPCRFLLVIKDTADVRRIYLSADRRREGAHLAAQFGKRYGYNVRGRNVRDTRHLLIANYATPETTV